MRPPIPSPHTLFLSPGLGRQEGKFDEAVGEERDTLLGDAGNLQPVFQNVQFHRLPRAPPQRIIRGGPSCGEGGGRGRAAAPAPCAPQALGQPAQGRGPGARSWTDLYSIQKKGSLASCKKRRPGEDLRGTASYGVDKQTAPGGARRPAQQQLVFAVTNNLPLKRRARAAQAPAAGTRDAYRDL